MTRAVKPVFPPAPRASTWPRSPSSGCRPAARPWATVNEDAAGRRAGVERAAGSIATGCPTTILCSPPGDGLLIAAEHPAGDRRDRRRCWVGSIPDRLARIAATSAISASSSPRQGLTGVSLAELPMPASFPMHILHLRRYDVDIVPSPDADARDRRSRRRAGAARAHRRGARLLRRHAEVHRRVQLHLGRPRHGARACCSAWCRSRCRASAR